MQVEGTFRSHQVPLAGLADNPEHLRLLEEWMRSYRPDELFDATGGCEPEIAALSPEGDRRMGATPLRQRRAAAPRPRPAATSASTAVDVPAPGRTSCRAHPRAGPLAARRRRRATPTTFRIMGPDETASNRLSAVFEATDRVWMADIVPGDDHLAPQGRVMEVLSEHLCQGWLEGYLLTGRHGLFNCYEAFTHIVDSMFNQHAKWLKVTREPRLAGARSRRSRTCCRATSGGRTTTASRTRTPASSTTS